MVDDEQRPQDKRKNEKEKKGRRAKIEQEKKAGQENGHISSELASRVASVPACGFLAPARSFIRWLQSLLLLVEPLQYFLLLLFLIFFLFLILLVFLANPS